MSEQSNESDRADRLYRASRQDSRWEQQLKRWEWQREDRARRSKEMDKEKGFTSRFSWNTSSATEESSSVGEVRFTDFEVKAALDADERQSQANTLEVSRDKKLSLTDFMDATLHHDWALLLEQ